MKILRTFENWTSDIKQYFLSDDGELDYDSWYKTWKITKSKLYSKQSGYVLFEYPPLEPDWDESPTFSEIEWYITDDNSIHIDVANSSLDSESLEWEHEDQMVFYIMFETLEDKEVKLKWFNNDEVYFNNSNAEIIYDGKYLEDYKKMKKLAQVKKFKI